MVAGELTTARPERYAFIHALRGVAALLVVWSHLSGFWLLERGKTSVLQDAWQTWIAGPFHIFQNGGHLGVVLFFLISGFIITHTSMRETYGAFAVKRALRIFPPLLFATVISALLLLLAAATDTTLLGVNGGSVWHWLASTVLLDGFLPEGRALDVTWTLVVEIVFYLITFALLGASKKNPLRALWLMAGIWVVLTLLFVNTPRIHVTNNGTLTIYVGFLILGRIIYLWSKGLVSRIDAIVCFVFVALMYCLFTETQEPGFLLAPGGWVGIAPVVSYVYALVIFVAMMRIAPKRVVQPFQLLGDVSYSLYLLHIPVGITVLNLLDLAGVPTWANTLIAIAVSIAVSWVAFRLIEVPTQKLARRILRKPVPISS